MSDWSALDRYLDDQAAELTSASLVVVRSTGTVHRHVCGDSLRYTTVPGRPHAVELPVERRVPATAATLYDLASNTKMWATNLALMILVDAGRLDLERPVHTVEGWSGFTAGGLEKVRIVDLLRHDAGLTADPRYFDPRAHDPGAGLYCSGTPQHPVPRSRIIDVICRTPPQRPPGTGYLYSDLDYMILGLVVEQLTGRRLDDFLESGPYHRLGLRRTVFNPLDKGLDVEEMAATEPEGNSRGGSVDYGRAPDGSPAPIRRYTLRGQVHDEKAWYCMGGVSGHAGLFTDADELAVLLRFGLGEGVLDGEQIIRPATWRRFAAPQGSDPAARRASSHGLGWRVAPAEGPPYPPFGPSPTPGSIGHTGWTGTLTLVDRDKDLAIGLMTGARHRLGTEVGADRPVGYRDVVDLVYRALGERGTVM